MLKNLFSFGYNEETPQAGSPPISGLRKSVKKSSKKDILKLVGERDAQIREAFKKQQDIAVKLQEDLRKKEIVLERATKANEERERKNDERERKNEALLNELRHKFHEAPIQLDGTLNRHKTRENLNTSILTSDQSSQEDEETSSIASERMTTLIQRQRQCLEKIRPINEYTDHFYDAERPSRRLDFSEDLCEDLHKERPIIQYPSNISRPP